MKRKRKRTNRAEAADARAEAIITAAGWKVTKRRPADPRFVARKDIFEHDEADSVTRLYESDATLDGLAKIVERREREEARKGKAA